MELLPDRPGLALPLGDGAPDRTLGRETAPAIAPERATPDVSGAVVDGAYGADLPAGLMDRALVAQADLVAQQGPGQDPVAVGEAVATISERLESGFTNPVTHGDLVVIEDTIDALSPTNATRTFTRLTDDQLTTLAEQLTDVTPFVGGFDAGERSAFYDTLAERLDGAQLARVATALEGAGEGRRLGLEIAENALPGTRVGFVREAAGLAVGDEAAALAVGETLGSLQGADLDTALGMLAPAQLRVIVDESVETTTSSSSTHIVSSQNADTAERLLDALATSGDPLMRATAVDEAAAQLAEVEQGGNLGYTNLRGTSPEQIRDGITAVLDSDPAGVVRSLEQDVDRNGQGLTTYVASMIEADQSSRVGELLAAVGTDDGRQQAAGWVTERVPGDGDGVLNYENAQTLGYASGAVAAAIESITSNRQAQADHLKNIFNTTVSLGGGAHPVAGAAGTLLTGLADSVVRTTLDGYARSDQSLADTLQEVAFPRNTDGSLYNGGAEVPYDAAFSRVLDRQQ